jgi:hypothetical protein
LVVNSLTDEERAFADWMKDEIGLADGKKYLTSTIKSTIRPSDMLPLLPSHQKW